MKYIFIGLWVMLLVSCGGGNVKKDTTTETTTKTLQKFQLPQIPIMLTSPEERADFLMKHYWDNFNFTDTAYISSAEITEQAFADFINILVQIDASVATVGVQTMFKGAAADSAMYSHFITMSEKYLYDPNSPFRNENLYIAVLTTILNGGELSELNQIRPKYQLDLAMKNRVGDIAASFAQLKTAKGDLILLFFNNPECKTCEMIKEYIKEKGIDKKTRLLMVNPDEDGNKELATLYDLRAIPTLYLLDKNKRVLLKDAQIEAIEEYLIK